MAIFCCSAQKAASTAQVENLSPLLWWRHSVNPESWSPDLGLCTSLLLSCFQLPNVHISLAGRRRTQDHLDQTGHLAVHIIHLQYHAPLPNPGGYLTYYQRCLYLLYHTMERLDQGSLHPSIKHPKTDMSWPRF